LNRDSGKKKRERFARNRAQQPPGSMSIGRLRFRSSGNNKTSAGSGISQSLDAGDTSADMTESFEEMRVKRTVSAPSREGSSTPPTVVEGSANSPPPPPSSNSNLPVPPSSSSTTFNSPNKVTAHVCVLMEQEACDISKVKMPAGVVVAAGAVTGNLKPKRPNGSATITEAGSSSSSSVVTSSSSSQQPSSNTPVTPTSSSAALPPPQVPSKLQGIVQPVRSSTSSGWL